MRNGSFLNETLPKRPFGGRLFEKQLFRSYIQKKKLIELLENETISSENDETTTTTTTTSTKSNIINDNNEVEWSTAFSVISDYVTNDRNRNDQQEASLSKF